MTPEQRDSIEKNCAMLANAGTEHAHQRAFFAWLAWMKRLGEYPRADAMFAIPNGGLRDAITAARLKAEGVKAGVPDTFYPVPISYGGNVFRDWKHGLWIEFKKPKKGRESEKQSDRIEELLKDGYAVATCYTWQGATQAFTDYNAGKPVQRGYI